MQFYEKVSGVENLSPQEEAQAFALPACSEAISAAWQWAPTPP
jgi:hypothetical protein